MITSLTKRRADDAKHEVLTCEAEGVPEPSFQWSVNSTHVSVGSDVFVDGCFSMFINKIMAVRVH